MTTKEVDYTIAARPITVMRKQMNDKPYEASALDLSILRVALRAQLDKAREEFRCHHTSGNFSDRGKELSEEILATEDLIERFDNADNVWMEINV